MARKRKFKKLPAGELLRLACIYAERDQEALVEANKGCDDEVVEETRDFLRQLREYRLKRWGKTRLEELLSNAKPVSVIEFLKNTQKDQPFHIID